MISASVKFYRWFTIAIDRHSNHALKNSKWQEKGTGVHLQLLSSGF